MFLIPIENLPNVRSLSFYRCKGRNMFYNIKTDGANFVFSSVSFWPTSRASQQIVPFANILKHIWNKTKHLSRNIPNITEIWVNTKRDFILIELCKCHIHTTTNQWATLSRNKPIISPVFSFLQISFTGHLLPCAQDVHIVGTRPHGTHDGASPA